MSCRHRSKHNITDSESLLLIAAALVIDSKAVRCFDYDRRFENLFLIATVFVIDSKTVRCFDYDRRSVYFSHFVRFRTDDLLKICSQERY